MRKLKEKIIHDREQGIPPDEAERRMDSYEKEFDQQAQARATEPTPDYGSADPDAFPDDYQISSKPAFTAAAAVSADKLADKPAEAESASTETKPTTRPSGQGGMRLG